MKNQSKFFALLIVVIACFISCKKESTNGNAGDDEYYMKFKLDGEKVNYVDAGMTISTVNNYYAAALGGTNPGGQESISFALYSLTPLVSGTVFTGEAIQPGIALPEAVINYVSLAGGVNSYSSLLVNNAGELTNTKVYLKIIELTETTVKGNFYGDIYDIETGAKRTITDGEFYGIKQ